MSKKPPEQADDLATTFQAIETEGSDGKAQQHEMKPIPIGRERAGAKRVIRRAMGMVVILALLSGGVFMLIGTRYPMPAYGGVATFVALFTLFSRATAQWVRIAAAIGLFIFLGLAIADYWVVGQDVWRPNSAWERLVRVINNKDDRSEDWYAPGVDDNPYGTPPPHTVEIPKDLFEDLSNWKGPINPYNHSKAVETDPAKVTATTGWLRLGGQFYMVVPAPKPKQTGASEDPPHRRGGDD